jgi:hypothetical protein
MNNKKHLVYAEDLIYEIMQYPSRDLSKSLIHKCTKDFIKEHSVSIWQHIKNSFAWRFKKDV